MTNPNQNATLKMQETFKERNKGGRPFGSKNKPSPLIGKEVASNFLGILKPILPPQYYKEMEDAIRHGKSISTLSEAKITLKLMGPAIWMRLIQEANPPKPDIDPELAEELGETGPTSVEFAKDLNERLKVYQGMLQFINQLEKQSDDATDTRSKPILEVFARRGIGAGRIGILIDEQSGSLDGDTNRIGREILTARTVSDSFSERQVDLPDSSEE